jgi:hypothetical protein
MAMPTSSARRRHAGLIGTIAVAVTAAAACTTPPPTTPPTTAPPTPATTVVASVCPPDGSYSETVASAISPDRPAAGATVRFEIAVHRLQQDRGPLREAGYVFPVPAGVARVVAVDFADGNPSTWAVEGGELVVRFLGPGGGWLVNDFPRISVVAELSPALRPGTVIAWKPYARFQQNFAFADGPLACTVADPGLVLQRMTVAG